MNLFFKLVAHEPVSCSLMEWARWFEHRSDENKETWQVAMTIIGEHEISTVFIGLNHQFVDGGHPLLFETMVFGPGDDDHQQRYTTWYQATAGHAQICHALRNELEKRIHP